MAQKMSDLAEKHRAAATNVATQAGGGTTRAEVEGMCEVLKVMAARPDLMFPILKLCDQTKTLPIPG